MKSFKVTLKRGLIGTTQSQRDAVRCLGLRRINDSKMIKDKALLSWIPFTEAEMENYPVVKN